MPIDVGNEATRTAQLTATGAGIGSAVPVIGTAIGAAGGAVAGLGLWLYDYLTQQGVDPATAAAQAHQYDNTFVATPAQLAGQNYDPAIATGQQQQGQGFNAAMATGGQQASLAEALRARAEGRAGPSLAELQLHQATDSTGRQAASLIAGQRGINPGMAARLGANAVAGANQQAAGQAAILRAQEQQAAQAQLAGVLGQQRQGDIAAGGLGANLLGTAGGLAGQQRGQDLQAQMQAQQINADVASGNQRAQLAAAGLGQSADQMKMQADQANADRNLKIAAALAQGASAAGANANTSGGTPVDVPVTAESNIDGFSDGGQVPGKPKVAKDSPRNDSVPAMLSPGEIVLPLSIVDADDAPDRAAAFVEAIKRTREGGTRRYSNGGRVGGSGLGRALGC